MRGPARDAPSARERGAWLQPDQSVCGTKCVRRASHGLNGKAAPTDVRKRVASEEHQIGVALVDPERDLCSVIRIAKCDTSEAIPIPLQVRERVVERCRTDWPRLTEIIFRVFHGCRADRKATPVGPQHGSRGC